LVRRILGEPLADDLVEYLEQLRRTEAMMKLFRDLIRSAVNEAVAAAFSEE